MKFFAIGFDPNNIVSISWKSKNSNIISELEYSQIIPLCIIYNYGEDDIQSIYNRNQLSSIYFEYDDVCKMKYALNNHNMNVKFYNHKERQMTNEYNIKDLHVYSFDTDNSSDKEFKVEMIWR